jgi:hypothetical protein
MLQCSWLVFHLPSTAWLYYGASNLGFTFLVVAMLLSLRLLFHQFKAMLKLKTRFFDVNSSIVTLLAASIIPVCVVFLIKPLWRDGLQETRDLVLKTLSLEVGVVVCAYYAWYAKTIDTRTLLILIAFLFKIMVVIDWGKSGFRTYTSDADKKITFKTDEGTTKTLSLLTYEGDTAFAIEASGEVANKTFTSYIYVVKPENIMRIDGYKRD